MQQDVATLLVAPTDGPDAVEGRGLEIELSEAEVYADDKGVSQDGIEFILHCGRRPIEGILPRGHIQERIASRQRWGDSPAVIKQALKLLDVW